MTTKKKGAGGSLSRSQVVTVRLDPKLRYLAELAALKQRRTLSSYIEWAVQDSLSRVYLQEGTGYNNDCNTSMQQEADSLWDVDAPDRFVKLALRYPELLNYVDQKKWKLIRENGYLWKGVMKADKWTWDVSEEWFIFERLRDHWEKFCAVAEGNEDASVLPKWSNTTKKEKEIEKDFEPDEDIPF